MRFEIRVSRAIMGNDIHIKVLGEGGELVVAMATELDGFLLGQDELSNPSTHFERSFSQAGGWSPNEEHRLVATVTDQNGQTHVGTKIFVDGSIL